MVGAGPRTGVFTKSASYHFVRLCQLLNFPCILYVCTLSLAMLISDDLFYIH